MTLKKLVLKSGVNRENTRYTNEGGWYDSDKVRFRQGTPEKIGGWVRISSSTFLGVCRSLWNWVTIGALNLLGVGTNLKFYICRGGSYIDVTPQRDAVTLTDPFQTTLSSDVVTVTDVSGGYITGDFVTFYGATAVGGLTISGEYEITVIGTATYTIVAAGTALSAATGGGTVRALYQINVGPSYVVPLVGWGAGGWGVGVWGVGDPSTDAIRLWSQGNFGEDLVFGYRGGSMYYWDATIGLVAPVFTVTIASPAVVTTSLALADGDPIILISTGSLPTGLTIGTTYYVVGSTGPVFNLALTAGGTPIDTTGTQSGVHTISIRAHELAMQGGSTEVPTVQNFILISDVNRFIFAFGCNDYGSVQQDPLLLRWSDQESPVDWMPSPTNQAGSLHLSRGSEIITANQSRQEILVWTDSSLYSLQYVGAPVVWGAQLMGDNISIVGQNAVAFANGVSYWMGKDKFYKYDGRVQTLRCDLRQYVFEDVNDSQYPQICAGTNEGFNEIWWHYCSLGSVQNDKYVVYNYVEDVWYYGTMARTAWLDSGLRTYPLAATYSNNLVNHEEGHDDQVTAVAVPIEAYITSSEFDLDDGHQFMFIYRVLPDITFRGSSAEFPSATMYMLPLQNSGSGYNNPTSVGGQSFAAVTRTAVLPIESFTGQIFTRVRGRQMSIKVESTGLGVTWQLGSPRIDARPDGRR